MEENLKEEIAKRKAEKIKN